MTKTVLYAESTYPDSSVEERIYGPGVTVLMRNVESLDDLPQSDCDAANALMIARLQVTPEQLARFRNLQVVVRTGVGYDNLPRAQAAKQGALVCNVPDYGTAEVCDTAIAMMLALRRGVIWHHDAQRAGAPWRYENNPVIRRLAVQTLGIVGLGRIGTAVALRAKALGMKVVFFDPNLPRGADLAIGVGRAESLEELLRQSDVLSLHAPLLPSTRGLIGADELALLPEGAVLVNTARGPIVALDAVAGALRSGRLAGAGLDVIPVEPPVAPYPSLLKAYHAKEDWLLGRLLILPHIAYYSPEAWMDIRVKSAETARAAILTNAPQNVIKPEDF